MNDKTFIFNSFHSNSLQSPSPLHLSSSPSSSSSSSSYFPLLSLPNEVLHHTLTFIDPFSFSSIRCVCVELLNVTNEMKSQMNLMRWEHILKMSQKTKRKVEENLPKFGGKHADFLIESLLEMIQNIHHYKSLELLEFDNQSGLAISYELYFRLIDCLWNHVIEIESVVESVVKGEAEVTDNFEILDFCLRRYYKEIFHCFPPQQLPPCSPGDFPVRIESRKIWSDYFGDKMMVSFEDFEKMIFCKWNGSEENNTFLQYLRAFVNFPRDNIMTPYRFENLSLQFGEWDSFYSTFFSIVSRRPFIGLIDMEEAKRFLSPMQYVTRFSRTRPSSLAFTTRGVENEYHHYRTSEKVSYKSLVKSMKKKGLSPAPYKFSGIKIDSDEGMFASVKSYVAFGAYQISGDI